MCGTAIPENMANTTGTFSVGPVSSESGMLETAAPPEPHFRPEPEQVRTNPHVCSTCHTPMSSVGDLPFRVGGATGGKGWLLGNWNQLSEEIQSFSVYHCPGCGRIDLFEQGR